MTQPTDYSKINPASLLADALVLGASRSIQLQESEGQKELVNSAVLPIKENTRGAWDQLTKLGIQRGKNVDDLFCEATLPAGWKKQGTDHSMWSNLLDARGIIRASMFYKAAFYDRDAHINVYSDRFYVQRDYDRDDNLICFKVCDIGLERTVRRFDAAHYATKGYRDDGTIIIGAVLRDKFYHSPDREYSDAQFLSSESMEGVQLLDRDNFYKQFHHVNPVFGVIYGTDNLAQQEAIAFLKSLPKDDSQWTAEYDFPEASL